MKRVAIVVIAMTLAAIARADFAAGVRAYERGALAEAFEQFKALAQSGMAKAQHNLAVMYDEGRAVPRDPVLAVNWYRAAADQGYAPAQNNLAVVLQSGDGVVRDSAEAAVWYRKAAEQGHAPAQYNLGVMLNDGDGIAQDATEARRWLARAAAQGDADAVERLRAMAEQVRPPTEQAVQNDVAASLREPPVRRVQARLTALGYDPGPVDGVMGRKTRSAIEAFQRDNDLDVDGKPTQALLDRLDAAAATAERAG